MNLSKSLEYFDPGKLNKRIHIIGCGSIGATVAENLARFGVTNMVLYDFDTVQEHNIANQIYVARHVKRPKTECLMEILQEINPDLAKTVRVKDKGWNGEMLSGYVFLCVDNIDLRRQIVEANYNNPNVLAMFDFRTLLTSAQHYGANWKNADQKKSFLNSMSFSHEEAKEATPVSACGVTLCVAPNVRVISALGVMNFINLLNKGSCDTFINADIETMEIVKI